MEEEERVKFDAELLEEPVPSPASASSIPTSPEHARGMEALMTLMALPQT